MSLTVKLISKAEDLSKDDLSLWNRLAKNPFLRWEWMGAWWSTYEPGNQLYVLKVCRHGTPIAFAPWFLEKRLGTGRTIQFLGSGKACSDHLSLIVAPDDCVPVCEAISCWLKDVVNKNLNRVKKELIWDSIELIGVDQSDEPVNCLARAMELVGLSVQQSEGLGCYAIDLPGTWEEYIQKRSKSGRREIRRAHKHIDEGKIKVHAITSQSELDAFWNQFVTLHQRRRQAAGTTGCFDHPGFETFLRSAASKLLKSGLLELLVATADGTPVATQFALVDEHTWYFYQSGMEPGASDLRPGLSVFCYAIESTIQSGRKRFDMLRGDEPYKLRWRAELCSAQELRVCSPRATAVMRSGAVTAGIGFRNLLKSGIGFGQPTS